MDEVAEMDHKVKHAFLIFLDYDYISLGMSFLVTVIFLS